MPNTDALGQFILLSNPYKAQPSAAGFPPPAPAPVLNPPANLDQLFGLCLDEVESQEYTGHWEFKGTPHTIRKAIRIPYMYYHAGVNGANILVTDYLVIGFEGGGSA